MELTTENFNELVSGKSCVLKFYADWCQPCKAIKSFVTSACQQTGVDLIEINVDEHDDAATAYGVRSLPTVIVLKNGEIVDMHVGTAPAVKYIEMAEKAK